jgi:hypothetical protein
VLPRREKPREDRRGPLPLARFLLELFAAGTGQPVELGLAVVLGEAPFGPDVALLLEFEQRRVEGAVVQGEMMGAGLLDAAGDAIAVERPESLERL